MEDEKFDPDKGDCDLGPILAQLSRPDLELVVVKMLAKYPEAISVIIELANKEIDTEEIRSELAAALQTEDEECILAAWEQYLDRAAHCASFNNVAIAIGILSEVSDSFVGWVAQRSKDDVTRDPSIEPFVTKLEGVWSQALTQSPQQRHKELLEGSFKKLADWRNTLTPLLGPVFSDPMRSVKKSIQKLNKPTSSISTTTTTTTAAGASNAESSKRPKVDSET